MKPAVFLALVVGVAVAFQANLTSVAQRTMGPVFMVALPGLATAAVAGVISPLLAKPELTGLAIFTQWLPGFWEP